MAALSRQIGDRVLFAGISFAVPPNQVLAVRGPSGSGKTLLLRALAGLDPVASGEIALDGRPMAAWSMPAWRVAVAYVAQDAPVLSGTPADFAAAVARLEGQSGRLVESPAAIGRRIDIAPDRWEVPWSALSGGERQRVHLAVAVATRPQVLLLDEPTSALDAGTVRSVEAFLEGRSAVWVTHDEAQIERVADEVLEIGAGDEP